MAQQMVVPSTLGDMVDSRRATPEYNSGASAQNRVLAAPANALSVGELRTFLKGFDPFTYSDRNLDIMNTNDMVFAWRMCSGNHTSVSNYATAQVARTA